MARKATHNPDLRLKELGLELPPPCKPVGTYRPARLSGKYLYVSGHTPDDAYPDKYDPETKLGCGKVGDNVTLEEGYAAARAIGMAILSTVKEAAGSLNRVKCLVRATGVVACTADFDKPHKVMNGFSDLMSEVFGPEVGVGARSAIGVMSLPGNVPVEVTECIFELT